MSRLTAKDKTHPSPRLSLFLSNNVHNGALSGRYCVNNLNGDLGYWEPGLCPPDRIRETERLGGWGGTPTSGTLSQLESCFFFLLLT